MICKQVQLNGQTVLFQTIQFNASNLFAQFKCQTVWPIDRTLLGATTPGQSGPGSDDNEAYSAFPKAPALLESHQQTFSVIPGYSLEGVLPLCRDAVGIFYSLKTCENY